VGEGRLRDGVLVRGDAEPSANSGGEISNILHDLRSRDAMDRLRPWFAGDTAGCPACVALAGDTVPAPESLATALNVEWRPWAIPPGKGLAAATEFSTPARPLDIRG
jgi:hypothetical protein